MAANYENILSLSLRSTSEVYGGNDSPRVGVCSLCHKALSSDDEITGDLATGGVCGDCKFLLLEDFIPSTRRRLRGRLRHSSFESVDNILSQHAGQNHSSASVEEDQLVDGDNSAWSLQYASANTTPSGSRSWRQVLSDTDSDGFDSWCSLYGDNESSSSFRQYMGPHSETDSLSFSVYGGDSDISMDRHSFVGIGTFNLPDEGDEFDSDTDIDPMHAGLGQWNSDEDEEDEEEEEEGEGEGEREWDLPEVDEAEAARLHILLTSSPSESRSLINWEQRINATESEGIFSQIIRETWLALDDAELPHGANFGDFLDTRRFDDLFESFAENDSSRRGAPPAAASFVNNLPRVVISEEHKNHDELVCAICKDVLALGTKVNQLPCSHLYHSHCILPWLKTRNSCPLCRYELPTDDKDYEEGKQNNDGRNVIIERQQLLVIDDSFSDVSEVFEDDVTATHDTSNSSVVRGGRGRWLFLAAAPIVSLVGMVIVLWLGSNSQIEGTRHSSTRYLSMQNQQGVHDYGSQNSRENRSRRWWCPF
ncbi:uncharacterized protein [Cicer arietinum]|uniref:RING-type E3 ubiquitin transferase n=1 Tax=Cicer arietinum TaxID=3827 RepID=A0A1S2XPP4_CICAR|nr:uncharacterized protein LOC101510020 [Cicer arietinum]